MLVTMLNDGGDKDNAVIKTIMIMILCNGNDKGNGNDKDNGDDAEQAGGR